MTISESLFDLMVEGLLQISWVKLFSFVRGLNFLLFYGLILRLECVGYD